MMKAHTDVRWAGANLKVLGWAVLFGTGLCGQVYGQEPTAGRASSDPLFETMAVTTVVRQTAGGEQLFLGAVRTVFGGSWMVVQGVRATEPSGVRRLVDFDRERIIEVDSSLRTFWSLSFDRYADLLRRHEAADVGAPPTSSRLPGSGDRMGRGGRTAKMALVATSNTTPSGSTTNRDFTISGRLETLLAGSSLVGLTNAMQVGVQPVAPSLMRWKVREQVVVGESSSSATQVALGLGSGPGADRESEADVLLTDAVQFSPIALDALEKYERVLGVAVLETSATELVAAARRSSGGLLPVRSESRVFDLYGESFEYIEEITQLESAYGEIALLLRIPESFVEITAPIEMSVLRLEQEHRLDVLGSGARR